MTWKTKLKITGPSGSSLHFDGELTTAQKNIIVSVLHGLPDMAESKSYSKMLYAIAVEHQDDMQSELLKAWKQRDELNRLCEFNQRTMDELLKQRDELLAALESIDDFGHAMGIGECKRIAWSAIASVKGGAV